MNTNVHKVSEGWVYASGVKMFIVASPQFAE
jgi:hypothetical protein